VQYKIVHDCKLFLVNTTQLHNRAPGTSMASGCEHDTVHYTHDSVYEWHSFASSADVVLENGCLVLSQKGNPENKLSIQLRDEDLVRELTGRRARVQCGRLGIGASDEQRVYTNEDFDLEFSVDKSIENMISVRINAKKRSPFHATVNFEAVDLEETFDNKREREDESEVKSDQNNADEEEKTDSHADTESIPPPVVKKQKTEVEPLDVSTS